MKRTNFRSVLTTGSISREQAADPGVLLFGHRGYSALAPENTLAAFALLLEHNIPGVELDVRLSRDGRVMVIHDENLKRVTGLDALVQDCRASKLRRLDAGGWFGQAFRGEGIPLLEEVFELLGDRVYYDVELKWRPKRGGGLEEAVVDRIRASGLTDRCLISSFNPYCIRRVQEYAPEIPTAHIYAIHRGIPVLLRRGQAGFVIPTPFTKPRSDQVNLVSAFLQRRVLRSQILTWTVDDPEEATRLVHLGVRGIISNHPSRIKAVLL
ncbi:MAG: glycerophosphodiester phosphodiesterase [Spirochaetaceae bacterium]|nr:MAG: glycerophosphodiester phosphodiesterase [Spirochaetaceae bacterium]